MSVKSVVLLSGGLDSSLNLYEANKAGEVVLALSIDYGQRSAARELEVSRELCQQLGLTHKSLDLRWLGELGQSALTDSSIELPTAGAVEIDSHETSLQSAKAVWVPNRNGVFLNVAASFAESLGADQVVPGFNLEEASTFPDNSEEFVHRSTLAFALSTATKVKVHCYTITLNKAQMVQRALELGLPLAKLWPCYQGGDSWCGHCESCLRFKRAGGFEAAGLGE